MQELELAIHRHQSLYEQVTQAYTEVHAVPPPAHVPPSYTRAGGKRFFWEPSCFSLLFPCALAFIFRWSAAVLAPFVLICEENETVYADIKLWDEVQIEAVKLGRRCRFLSASRAERQAQRLSKDFYGLTR